MKHIQTKTTGRDKQIIEKLHIFSDSQCAIESQLRTGYVKLNEYQQKSNITENDKCQCGETESMKHFLLECELYENEREKLKRNLFRSCGIDHFDMNILLDLKPDYEFKEWRSSI